MTSQLNDGTIIRRRRCDACSHRWYTEQPAEQTVSPYVLQWSAQGKVIAFKTNDSF